MEDLEESSLQLAQSDVDASLEYSAKPPSAWGSRTPLEDVNNRIGGKPVADSCLVAHASEGVLGELGSQIDNRARDTRNRDPSADRRVSGMGLTRTGRPNPLDASFSRGGDVGWRSLALHEAP